MTEQAFARPERSDFGMGPRSDAPTGEAERGIIEDWRQQMLAELPVDHPSRARLEAVRITA